MLRTRRTDVWPKLGGVRPGTDAAPGDGTGSGNGPRRPRRAPNGATRGEQ